MKSEIQLQAISYLAAFLPLQQQVSNDIIVYVQGIFYSMLVEKGFGTARVM